MEILKIIGYVLVVIGAVINYGSSLVVNRFGVKNRVSVKEAEELSGEDLENYKMTKAKVRVKIIGVLVMLPGVIMLFIAYR